MRTIFTLLILLMINGLSYAQTTKPNICSPTGVLVNSFTGNMYYFRQDMGFPSIGNNDFQFSFYYNSANSQRNYGYGKGWTFSYHMRYKYDSLGVIIESNNGFQDLYSFDGAKYTPPNNNQNLLNETTKGKFVLTTSGGDRFYFDNPQSKRLTRMVDVYGNETLLSYNDTLITSVTDPAGRTVKLTWENQMLTSISENFGSDNLTVLYHYDDSLCLSKVIDPLGYELMYGYNDKNMMVKLENKNGDSTRVEYNINHAVKRIYNEYCDRTIRYDSTYKLTVVVDHVNSGNQFTTFQFDDQERVISIKGTCCGETVHYEYDEQDNIISRIDANGNQYQYTYDDRGNRLSSTDPMGHTTIYTYHPTFNKVASTTLPLGNEYRYQYNEDGDLIEYFMPNNASAQNEFDTQGLLTRSVDALGNATIFDYDQYGNLSGITDAIGNKSTMDYDDYGNLSKLTNADGGYVLFFYDKNGNITKKENSIGAIDRFEYDAEGNLIKRTDALGHISHQEYDGMNRVIRTINALGGISEVKYDQKGNISEVINELGYRTQYQYNTNNYLTTVINPLNETTSFFYDAVGNITGMELPNGHTLSYTFDNVDRMIRGADNLGTMASFTYDKNSNRISETDALGNVSEMVYDVRDRLIQVIAPLKNSASIQYDDVSNIIEQIDGEGHSKLMEYDALGRMIKEVNAEGGEVTYTYNKTNNLKSLTDPNGNTTQYTYDKIGRLLEVMYPNNETEYLEYDKRNQIIKKTLFSGDIIQYTYDALGRILQQNFSDKTAHTFAYDDLGRMLKAQNNDALVILAYDNANRLTQETLNGKTTTYSYQIAERKNTIIYPTGRTIERNYNTRDQLIEIVNNGASWSSFEYSPKGQMLKKTLTNGVITDFSYDDNGRMNRIVASDIIDFSYTFNRKSNITSRINGLKDNWSEFYGYDKTGQVTAYLQGVMQNQTIPAPENQIDFEFDLGGNRKKTIANGVTEQYQSNSINAYTQITGSPTILPEYDKNGNMLFDGNHRYSYNLNNKITQVDDGATAKYAYDALGRRIRKVTGTDTINYYYSGVHVIEEQNGAGELLVEYVYGQSTDELISMKIEGKDYFYHTDILGSVHAITNNSGKVEERYSYGAFGQPAIYDKNYNKLSESQIDNPYLFTGRRWDAESNLYYYRARYYNGKLGRFLQQDPIGYWDDYNLYRYCGNNSIVMIDPFGLDGSSVDCNNKEKKNIDAATAFIRSVAFAIWLRDHIKAENAYFTSTNSVKEVTNDKMSYSILTLKEMYMKFSGYDIGLKRQRSFYKKGMESMRDKNIKKTVNNTLKQIDMLAKGYNPKIQKDHWNYKYKRPSDKQQIKNYHERYEIINVINKSFLEINERRVIDPSYDPHYRQIYVVGSAG